MQTQLARNICYALKLEKNLENATGYAMNSSVTVTCGYYLNRPMKRRKIHYTFFGVSRIICGVHLCAAGHAATFAVTTALMTGQWQHRAWSFHLHPFIIMVFRRGTVDFSRGQWNEISFDHSKLREKHFSTKKWIENHQISKSKGAFALLQPLPTPMSMMPRIIQFFRETRLGLNPVYQFQWGALCLDHLVSCQGKETPKNALLCVVRPVVVDSSPCCLKPVLQYMTSFMLFSFREASFVITACASKYNSFGISEPCFNYSKFHS